MVKFLLTLFIFFFLVRYVVPALLRLLVGAFVQKQTRRYSDTFGQQVPPRRPTEPGKVRVDYVPPATKNGQSSEFKGGEYVDFEEVK